MSDFLGLYVAAVSWCLVHLAAYCLLRFSLASEIRIFAFQAASFGLFLLAVAAISYLWNVSKIVALGLVSVHGIYSLTFLWFWSGTEGSYSLSIMRELRSGPATEVRLTERLAQIGSCKKTNRLRSLENLKLIRLIDGNYRLSRTGAIVAAALATLRALANQKSGG